jgi:adenosylcobinamide-GDP ribazoletransferase
MHRAAAYLPWVGLLLGGLCALLYLRLSANVGHELAVWGTLSLSLWITGAYHEDGFADFCDGMGGGWDREQILQIMKDSRLGTYGVLGLVVMFLLKGTALSELSPRWVPWAFLVMHVHARWVTLLLQNVSTYVPREAQSKVQALAPPRHSWPRVLVAGALSLLLAALALPLSPLTVLLLGSGLLLFVMRQYLQRRLGGYTGDCLGALEQLLELWTLLIFAAVAHAS